MKFPLSLFHRIWPVVFLLLAVASGLRAQVFIDNHAYYTLDFNFKLVIPGSPFPTGGSGSVQIWDEVNHYMASSSIGAQATAYQQTLVGRGNTSARIFPNRDYVCSLSVQTGCTATTSFAPSTISGYVVYIDGRPSTSVAYTGVVGANVRKFTLRIALANNYSLDPEPDYLAAGTASSMVSDKPIMYFGLGHIRNGVSAGVIGFRAQDFASPSFFTPAALYFASYSQVPVGEVTLIPVDVNANPIVLQQVLSREVLVNVSAPTGTSYTLDFYPASAVTGQPGGANTPFTYSGSPFVSYTVAQNTTSGISVTRVEDAVTWETNLVLSGTTWTFNGWHKQGTSLNSYVSTGFSSATAATVSVNGPASGLGASVSGYTDTALGWAKAYTSYTWGLELTNTTLGSSTAVPLATNSAFYTSSAASGTSGAYQGLAQWVTQSDGTWSAYSYYVGDATNPTTVNNGGVQRVYRPWLDTTAADNSGTVAAAATTTNSAYDDYTYAYVNKGDSGGTGGTAALFMPTSIVSSAPGGILLKKTTWNYNTRATTLNSLYVWSQAQSNYYNSSQGLTTTSLYYVPQAIPSLLDDQPVSVTYPTGRKDSYAYFNGSWNAATNTFTGAAGGTDRLILCFHGQTSGGTAVTAWTNGSVTWSMDSVSMVQQYSTATEVVIDTNGRTVFSGENVYTSSATLARISGLAYTYDGHGRLTDSTDILRGTGTSYKTHRVFTSALLNSETAPDGTTTSYQYDDLLRPTQKTIGVTSLSNASIYPARVEATTYDGANRPVATYTCNCGTAPTVFWYDAAGRVTQQSSPSPNSLAPLYTNYTFSSLVSTTTTQPTGATTVNTNYADGRVKSVSGSAQAAQYYDYAANGTGIAVTRYNKSSADPSMGGSFDQADLLGRNVTHSSPTYNWSAATNPNNVIDVTSTFDSTTGLLTKRRTTYRTTGALLVPDHLYSYTGGDGRLTEDGLDVNADNSLTAAGTDRYVSYGLSYGTDANGWLSTATTLSFPTGTALQVAKTVTRLTGFNSVTNGSNPVVSSGVIVADVTATDVNNQVARQVESVDAATLRHHVDITAPGVSLTSWVETINGYSAESLSSTGARSKNEYDSLGRLVAIRSRWNGTSYAAADTVTFSSSNYSKLPDSQTINSVVTNFSYSWGATIGTSTKTATDAAGNANYTLYNAMGLPSHTGGTANSPTQYGYDELGRLVTMTTWRTGPYTEVNWPALATGDTTTWTIESVTGLGTKKTFQGGNHVDYTFTPLGQPLTRTWARTPTVTTTYAYFDGSTTTTADPTHRTQELRSVTYSDGTPSVSYTYNRAGLPVTVTDSATGVHTFAYNAAQPFRVDKETLDTFYGGRVETQQYDAVFRPAGFKLSNVGNTASDVSQVWTYAPTTGLPSTLVTTPTGQAARTFTYSFNANNALYTGYSTGTAGTAFVLTHGYETATNRRNQTKSTMGGATVVEFDPVYDNRGMVQTMAQSGSAFGDYYNGSYSSVLNAFTYDAMGQLKQAGLYQGNATLTADLPSGTAELPGHKFIYSYDSMGNRKSAGESGNTVANGGTDDSYTPNALNQYDQKDNYTVRVTGTTTTASTVYTAVSNAPSTNQKDHSWAADITPAQGANVASATVTVFSAIPGNSSTADVIRTDSSKTYTVAPNPQVFHYDLDGNLSDDGIWIYSYDAENRIIAMQNLASAIGTGKIATANARKLSFTYDYLGRRVEKKVYGGWTGTTYSSTAITDRKFAYYGWNVVAEYNVLSSSVLTRSYTWGLDLAGSFNATGGVGALVQITDHPTTKNYYSGYDNNGNICAMIRDNGSLAAGYEYSSFGEPMRADVLDSTLVDNPFRFSTKYTDSETGLIYYGMRYYSPTLGRFINRDPVDESGGINLYGFVSNNPISRVDVLGLSHYETVCQLVDYSYWKGDILVVSQRTECQAVLVPDPTGDGRGGGGGGNSPRVGGNSGAGKSGGGAPNREKLLGCYKAALAAFQSDTGRTMNNELTQIEGVFGSIAGMRSIARMDVAIGTSKIIRDTALSTGLGFFTGYVLSANAVRIASSARGLYGAAKTWQEVNAVATIAAGYQRDANVINNVTGLVTSLAYTYATAESNVDLAVGFAGTPADFMAETQFNQVGAAFSLSQLALDSIAASHVTEEQANSILSGIHSRYQSSAKRLAGRLQAATADCDKKYK